MAAATWEIVALLSITSAAYLLYASEVRELRRQQMGARKESLPSGALEERGGPALWQDSSWALKLHEDLSHPQSNTQSHPQGIICCSSLIDACIA